MLIVQFDTEAKFNAIFAILELLELVSFNGTVITIDAMGTQREIAERIVDGGSVTFY